MNEHEVCSECGGFRTLSGYSHRRCDEVRELRAERDRLRDALFHARRLFANSGMVESANWCRRVLDGEHPPVAGRYTDEERAEARAWAERALALGSVSDDTATPRRIKAMDSARWCAVCNAYGDHHTDRHPADDTATEAQ